jgi:hypothetical protein
MVQNQQGKVFMRPYLEKTHHKKRAGGVTQGVGSEFKPQYHKKKKPKQNKVNIFIASNSKIHTRTREKLSPEDTSRDESFWVVTTGQDRAFST